MVGNDDALVLFLMFQIKQSVMICIVVISSWATRDRVVKTCWLQDFSKTNFPFKKCIQIFRCFGVRDKTSREAKEMAASLSPLEDVHDIFLEEARDMYENLPEKVVAAFRYIHGLYPHKFRYFFKVDDDCCFNVMNMLLTTNMLLTSDHCCDYAGSVTSQGKYWSMWHSEKCSDPALKEQKFFVDIEEYCCGPTYFLSDRAVEVLTEQLPFSTTSVEHGAIYEDVEISKWLKQYGNISPYKQFHPFSKLMYTEREYEFLYAKRGYLSLHPIGSSRGRWISAPKYSDMVFLCEEDQQNERDLLFVRSAVGFLSFLFRRMSSVVFMSPQITVHVDPQNRIENYDFLSPREGRHNPYIYHGRFYHAKFHEKCSSMMFSELYGYPPRDTTSAPTGRVFFVEWGQTPKSEAHPVLLENGIFEEYAAWSREHGETFIRWCLDEWMSGSGKKAPSAKDEEETAAVVTELRVFLYDEGERARVQAFFSEYEDRFLLQYRLLPAPASSSPSCDKDKIHAFYECNQGGVSMLSTASWWGGLFNPNPEKVIFFPRLNCTTGAKLLPSIMYRRSFLFQSSRAR